MRCPNTAAGTSSRVSQRLAARLAEVRYDACVMIALLLLAATAPLPDYFKLAPKVVVNPDSVVAERYGQTMINLSSQPAEKRGRHWYGAASLSDEGPEQAEAWTLLKDALISAGWTAVAEQPPSYLAARWQKGGKDAWAAFSVLAWNDLHFDLVEVHPYSSTFAVRPPGARGDLGWRNVAEAIVAGKDFPWLPPPPGAKFQSDSEGGAFYANEKGEPEPVFVSPTSMQKSYELDASYSPLELVTMYREALSKAGWRIVEESQGINQGDMALTAQYAKNGRNVWAYIHGPGTLALKVADVGAGDVAAALEKECHLPLWGVYFAFNKATLAPTSEPTLRKVAAALAANPALVVEVQGHTDDAGGDAANEKLSEARASAVMKWLTAHRVPAKRLSARGYGKAQPIADNGSPDGRAKNRRIELRRSGCTEAAPP